MARKRPKTLRKVLPPEVALARSLLEMMLAAGMPKDFDKATFTDWHRRLYRGELTYRAGHLKLMELLRAKRAKG